MKLKEIFPQETKDHLDQKSLQSGANLRTGGGGDKDGSINIFCKFCIFAYIAYFAHFASIAYFAYLQTSGQEPQV